MNTIGQDVRYALRTLLKSPGFAIAAITVLALGIGANTAVFSLVNAVLLRPLPFPEPQRLMAVRLTDPRQDMFDLFGDADFIAFRDQQKSFSHVAAYGSGLREFNFSNGSEPGRVRGVAVTADFFETLGLTPERGRTFQPQDDRAEAPLRRRSQPRVLAETIGQRPQDCWKRDQAQWSLVCCHRRHATRHPVSTKRIGRCLAAHAHTDTARASAVLSRRVRSAETRREPAPGRRRTQHNRAWSRADVSEFDRVGRAAWNL